MGGPPGSDPTSLLTIRHSLVAIRDYTFLLGPNIAPVINAVLFGTLLYKSRLVPRIIPIMGLIAAPCCSHPPWPPSSEPPSTARSGGPPAAPSSSSGNSPSACT